MACRDRSPLPPPSPATPAVGEGNDNRPRLLSARPLTLPRRLLGPKLAKSPSAASGAVIQQRRGPTPGPEKVTESRGRLPRPDSNAREPGRQAGSYLSCFSGARLLRGAGLALPQSQLRLGVVFPIVPDQELSPGAIGCGKRRDRRRPNQSGAFSWRGGAGRGGAGGRRL